MSPWKCIPCHMLWMGHNEPEIKCLFKTSFWVLWDHTGQHLSFYQSESRCHASGQILSLAKIYLILLHSLDFCFGGQWLGCRNCFWQDWLLTMTLQPCCLSFNVQDIMLMRSYRFLNHAATSADGCCLYIIIHNSMSWWDWGVGLVPQCGRSEPESFKSTDTYACSSYHTSSSYIGSWLC